MESIYKFYFTLFLTIVLSSCQENRSPEILQPEEINDSIIKIENKQFVESDFELGTVVIKNFPSILDVFGNVHLPKRSKASVSTLMNGTIGAIDWIEGQWVKKGTNLFTITNPELINMQEEYLVLRSQLTYLKEEFIRQEQLVSENITTKKDFLKIKSELATADAKYNSIKKKLDLYGIETDFLKVSNLVSSLTIHAPISGYISEINILRGDYLESSTMAMKIENTYQVHVELSVLEKDAADLKKGQDIVFYTQNNSVKEFRTKINLIKNNINAAGNIKVQAFLDEETKKYLSPGMNIKAEILLKNQEILALPTGALVKTEGVWYALKLVSKDSKGYNFEQTKVEVGKEYNGYRSIENVDRKTEYLTKGAYFLIQ